MELIRKVNHIHRLINKNYIREIEPDRRLKYNILLNLYLRIKILIDSENYESALVLMENEKDYRINNFDMSFLSSDYIDIVCTAMDLKDLILDKLII